VAAIKRRTVLSEGAKVHLRFLTLFDDKSRSTDFEAAPYSALLNGKRPLGAEDPLADQLVTALFGLLTPFYDQAELDLDARLLDQLKPPDGAALDGGYLAFCAFVKMLRLPTPDVEAEYTFRDSKRGRRFYGAAISRPSWRTSQIEKQGDRWMLPVDCRHIHLQARYDVLAGDFFLAVYYETNPYYSDDVLTKRVPADQYGAYKLRREAFKAHCTGLAEAGFKPGNTLLQIAKANLSFKNITVREATRMVEEHIARATEVIDEAVRAEFGVPLNSES
jgi:hypothetical protein